MCTHTCTRLHIDTKEKNWISLLISLMTFVNMFMFEETVTFKAHVVCLLKLFAWVGAKIIVKITIF